MDRAKQHLDTKTFDGSAINAIIAELDAVSAALIEMSDSLGPTDFKAMEFQLDALTTSFLDVGLVPKEKLEKLSFHLAIKALIIPLPQRASLAARTQTFEDLISGYGDEPSSEEISEAIEIWETVTMALKEAFSREAVKNQLPLLEN
jgi:hypothetical protein